MKMKNKLISSSILWFSVLSFGSYFLVSLSKINKPKALEESTIFLKNASFEVHNFLVKQYLEDLSPLTDARDIRLFSKIDTAFFVADSLYEIDRVFWKALNRRLPNYYTSVSEKEWLNFTVQQKEMSSTDEGLIFIYEKKPILNYKSKKESIQKLHKLWLYQSYIEIWKKTLFRFGYWRVDYDKFDMSVVNSRSSKLALIYSENKNASEELFIRSNKNKFSNEKDTTILFPKFDAFSTNYKGKNEPYFEIKIKKGQKYDFEINELKDEK